jgi:hypothetical protein
VTDLTESRAFLGQIGVTAMTAFRLISLPTHAVLELLVGIGLLAAPFALGFGPAGAALSVVLGVLLVGLSLGVGEGLPVSTHLAFDQALVIGLAAGAVALAVADDRPAALAFVAGATLQLVLTLMTRYSRQPLRRR